MNDNYEHLRDPNQKLPLTHKGNELIAADRSRFPIVNEIPRFVSSENYAGDFGKQWNRFPATQLDSHSGITLSRDRLERCAGGDRSVLKGKRVSEAGSGAGRSTEVLPEAGAVLDSFDCSSAVEANAANNGDADSASSRPISMPSPFRQEATILWSVSACSSIRLALSRALRAFTTWWRLGDGWSSTITA